MLELLSIYSSNAAYTITYILLFVIAVIPVFKWLASLLRMYIIARDIPGPSGNLLTSIIFNTTDPSWLFKVANECSLQFGKLYRVWLVHKLIVFMTDRSEVKYVMSNLKQHHRSYYVTKSLKVVFGNGIIALRDGKVYKTHLRTMQPMFYPAVLKNYRLVFEEKLSSLCEILSNKADDETIDIYQYLSSYTLEAICATVVGCDEANMGESAKEFLKAARELEHMAITLIFQPWLRIPGIQRFFANGRRHLFYQTFANSFIERIVAEKMQAASKTRHLDATRQVDTDVPVEKIGEGKSLGRRKVLSMLDMIVKATMSDQSYNLTFEDIKDEILGIIAGGFVTSATTLSFMFILLGIHEEVQEEVSRELEEVFGSSLRAATTEDLSRLVVLERVIKETLRMFPPVPLLPREVNEDIRLPSGKVLPTGSEILVDVFHLQRDPESYQDPESFIPERWLPENSSLLKPDAFIPFGTVSRTCIGFRYAMLQMRLTACNLLRRFKVTTNYKMEDLTNLGFSITLVLNGEFKVQLLKREVDNSCFN